MKIARRNMLIRGLRPLDEEEKIMILKTAFNTRAIFELEGRVYIDYDNICDQLIDFVGALEEYCRDEENFFLRDIYRDGM